MVSVRAVTVQRGSAARFRPLRAAAFEVVYRAPSSQTASTGRTCGRPVGCTGASQYMRVSRSASRTVCQGNGVVGSAAIRSADFGSGPDMFSLPMFCARRGDDGEGAESSAGGPPRGGVEGDGRGAREGLALVASRRGPGAVSSAGERFPDTEEVTSSNLVRPTVFRKPVLP